MMMTYVMRRPICLMMRMMIVIYDAANVSINSSDDKSKTLPIEEQDVKRSCSGPVIKPYNWDTMSERENISGLLLFAADSTPLKEKFCD